MTSQFISVPTMEGDLVIELYASFSPRACAYLTDLLSDPQIAPHLRFSERDKSRVVVTATAAVGSSSFAPGQHFFGDELGSTSSGASLAFTGAGIIGVPIEPSLKSCAFFVSLRPAMEELGGDCVVVGRVARGMNSVIGAVTRARVEGEELFLGQQNQQQQRGRAGAKLVKPMEIIRAGRKFVEATPMRPVLPSQQQQQQQSNHSRNATSVKGSSLLDSMF